MLPLTRIDLDTISTDPKAIKGNAFLFGWEKVIDTCRKANLTLDRFLTIRIGSYIQSKNYKTPILILYVPTEEYFKLTICSKGNVDFLPCLHSTSGMVGYLEYGSEYVESNAKCFLYFTGQELIRTYHPLEWPLDGDLFASDFGNLFCLNIFSVDEEFYDELKTNPMENPEYSFVPKSEIENIVTPQSNLTIRHSFVSFGKTS